MAKQRHPFGHNADVPLYFERVGDQVLAKDLDGAGAGGKQPGQHFDGGRLACAIGTKKAEELSGLDSQIKVVNGCKSVEGAGELLRQNRGLHDWLQ